MPSPVAPEPSVPQPGIPEVPPNHKASDRHYICLTLTGGLHRAGESKNTIQTVALYALTGLAALTGIGTLFWLALRSKIKTREVGLQFFSLVGTLLLAFTPVVGWAILYGMKRLVLTPHAKDVVKLQSDLADSVIQSMNEYQKNGPQREKIPPTFEKAYEKIDNLITLNTGFHSLPTYSPWSVSPAYDRLRLLRTELSKLLRNRAFIQLQEGKPKDPFVIHIQALCHIMRSGGSSKPFAEFGKTLLDASTPHQPEDGYTLRNVSKILTDVIQRYQGLNHESLADSVAHRILSPTKTLSSLSSQTSPAEYDPWGSGNIDTGAWTYHVTSTDREAVDYAFHFGPSPHEGDPLFQADLNLYRTCYTPDGLKYSGPPFLQHNLQTQHGHEGVRSKSQHRISEKNPQLAFMTTPMDGAFWKLSDHTISNPESINSFCEAYYRFAKGTTDHAAYLRHPEHNETPIEKEESANGFYIPGNDHRGLDASELKSAFDLVGNQIKPLLPIEPEDKKIVLRGTQLIIQATLFLKMLAKSAAATPSLEDRQGLLQDLNTQLQKLLEKGSVGQACKQDIDRGLSMNILTRLMVMKMSGEKITRAILEEVVGEVLGRAEIVDRRMILLDRITPALCALELLDDKPDFFRALQTYLGAKISVS